MIINKTTSNTLLVSTLVVTGVNNEPVKNVTEFNTDTLETTLEVGGMLTATSFMFVATNVTDESNLHGLLNEDLVPRIVMNDKEYRVKKAMDNVSSPDNYLMFRSFIPTLRIVVATCTNCNTKFLLYIDEAGELWVANKINAGDTFETLTQVNETGLTCDNCNVDVALYDENLG